MAQSVPLHVVTIVLATAKSILGNACLILTMTVSGHENAADSSTLMIMKSSSSAGKPPGSGAPGVKVCATDSWPSTTYRYQYSPVVVPSTFSSTLPSDPPKQLTVERTF